MACDAVIKAPLFKPASTTRIPWLQPLMMRFRMGKVWRSGSISIENSDTIAPFPSLIFSARARFSGGYNLDNPEPIAAIVRPLAARADNSDRMLIALLYFAPNIEDDWRRMDFAQRLRIRG